MPTGQSDGGNSSVETLSSKTHLGLWQVNKTKQNTMSPSSVPETYVFLYVGEPESFGPASLSHCG